MTDSFSTRRNFARNCAGAIAWTASSRITGRTVFAAERPSEAMRFGVFSLFQPQRLILHSDEALVLHLDKEPPDLLQAGRTLSIQLAPRHSLTVQWGGRSITVSHLRATATSGRDAVFTLSIPPPALHGTITRCYSGTLELMAAQSFLQPIVVMQQETALACIVHAESPAAASLEYLAAQAVVSRSFLRAAHTGHFDFDFCDTTHCQYLREAPAPHSAVFTAVRQTRNLCLIANSNAFAAMYSRSCSGRTHTLAELGLPTGAYPYYSVPCEYCLHHPERWSRQLPAGDLPRGESGRIAYNRIHGWSALPSSSFSQGAAQITGRGVGHGLGLCQRGAAAMAEAGVHAQEILTHYYPNTSVTSIPD